MHFKLKDQQLKIVLFIYRLPYQNLIVTTNQKPTIDTHTQNKKESKHNTKSSYQMTREENKRRRGEKRPTKNIQINFHCKVKELLQWRITGLNVNIMT